MKTEMYTLPTAWHDALINQDYSSLGWHEIAILTWLESNGFNLDSCVSVAEYDPVVMNCRISPSQVLHCECSEYTFTINE